MKSIALSFAGMAMIVMLIGLATPPMAESLDLRFAYHSPAMIHWNKDGYQPWANEVAKRTNGRVNIRIYPASTLGKATEEYDMITKGLVDISVIAVAFYPGRFPLEDVFHLPFLCPGPMGDPTIDNIIKMVYEKYLIPRYFTGVKVLWWARYPPHTLHMAKKPVRKMEDLKGLVIGYPGGRIAPKMFGLMGASAEFCLVADMYTNLERGVIDGMDIPLDTVPAFKLHEVEKYNTMLDYGSGTNFVAMNLKTWSKISPADQKIIEDLSPWVVERHIKGLAGVSGYAMKLFRDAGVEAIDLSPEEKARWKKTAMPIWDEWVEELEGKGLPGRALVDDVLKIVDKKQ